MPTTILAVDDSATMRKALEITFAGTEFHLVTCDSPAAALEKVKTQSPALVIVDVSLPPTDGYELLGTLKAAAPQIPVLMLSSKHHPFDEAKGAQAESHMDKPFDTQALQDRARELTALGAAKPAAAPVAAAAKPPAAAVTTATVQKGGAALTPRAAPVTAAAKPAGTGAVATRMGPFAPPAGAAQASSFKDTMPMPGRAVQDAAATARANLGAKPATAAQQRPAATGPGSMAARSPFGQRPAAEPAAPAAAADEGGLRGRAASGTLPGVPLGGTAAAAARGKEASPAAIPSMKRTTVSSWPAPAGKDAAAADVSVPTTPKVGKDVLAAAAADAGLPEKLAAMGLTPAQVEGVLALSREVVEKVVWEVVPVLAETIIKEEIARLTA